ncbi:MAG: corrinoid protein [Deltaproteobacteria bacterium]|nr:corrinoid protein [Deltaproteobacteria bacterium]
MEMEELIKAVIEGNAPMVSDLVLQGLDEGLAATTILAEGLTPGMATVGDLFQKGEYFLPEMLFSAKAMKSGLEHLESILSTSGSDALGIVVIGTVKGDLHDIGKNIVAMLMKGAGFKVIDLGVDIPVERFLEVIVEEKANIVALSALLSTTMPAMENIVKTINESDVKDQVKIVIGGAPITSQFADEIGADGYAKDAPSAVNKVRELLKLS